MICNILIYVYIGSSHVLEPHTMGWGGMRWDVNVHVWTCRSSWCYAHAGWGGGVMGWDVNVHVSLQKQLMLRTRGVGWGGGMGWDVNLHVNLQGGKLTFMWTCRSSWCYAHAGWGGGGWGGMLTFMWTCRSSWCYAHAGWGGGWDGVGC